MRTSIVQTSGLDSDGTIRVSSELGMGSCFTVELPNVEIGGLVEETPEDEKYLTHEKVDFQPATVLLVDDIQANRHLVNAYLQG